MHFPKWVNFLNCPEKVQYTQFLGNCCSIGIRCRNKMEGKSARYSWGCLCLGRPGGLVPFSFIRTRRKERQRHERPGRTEGTPAVFCLIMGSSFTMVLGQVPQVWWSNKVHGCDVLQQLLQHGLWGWPCLAQWSSRANHGPIDLYCTHLFLGQ